MVEIAIPRFGKINALYPLVIALTCIIVLGLIWIVFYNTLNQAWSITLEAYPPDETTQDNLTKLTWIWESLPILGFFIIMFLYFFINLQRRAPEIGY